MGERRFLVEPGDLGGGRAVIRKDELHHLLRVLRLRPGDEVAVFDGAGRGFRGSIESLGEDSAVVALSEAEAPDVEPTVRLTLFQGIPHGERMDFIVEKATELGASRIVPVLTARGVVKPRSGGWGRLDRWRRIALSAAKQSGRLVVPEVAEPLEFEKAAASSDRALRVVFHPGCDPFEAVVSAARPLQEDAALLVGPEGGFTDSEVEFARECGWQAAGLGPRILRADTAAVVSMALLASLLTKHSL